MDANPPNPPQLEYSPTPPLHHRRKFKKSVLLIVVLAILVVISPGAFRRGRQLYWQRQCMNFEMPQDRVALQVIGPAVVGAQKPLPWIKFAGAGSRGNIVYLHARRAADGIERLVVVEVFNAAIPNDAKSSMVMAGARSIDPGNGWKMPSENIFPDDTMQILGVAGQIAVHGGVSDPSDDSHFTFNYSVGAKSVAVDGWLREGGPVVLQLRSDSTAQPSSTTQP